MPKHVRIVARIVAGKLTNCRLFKEIWSTVAICMARGIAPAELVEAIAAPLSATRPHRH